MAHRSKLDFTPRRCSECGVSGAAMRGSRYTCPYKALHKKAEETK